MSANQGAIAQLLAVKIDRTVLRKNYEEMPYLSVLNSVNPLHSNSQNLETTHTENVNKEHIPRLLSPCIQLEPHCYSYYHSLR